MQKGDRCGFLEECLECLSYARQDPVLSHLILATLRRKYFSTCFTDEEA